MTGLELVTHMRESILDDASLPYLWSGAEILRFLNYAEVQTCRRAHLIIDASTASDNGTAGTAGTLGQQPLCTLPIVANTATYTLSPKILQIKRCQLLSMAYPLDGPKMYGEVDELLWGWMGTGGTIGSAGVSGSPVTFLNEPGNTITFIQAPSANDTAKLVVSRIPLTPFTLQSSPEIAEKYHEGLMDWAAHLAFMKPDSQTQNLNLAKWYEEKFIRQFGQLPDAYSDRIRKTLSQKGRMRPREFGS
jgi:hypothetical protein